MLDDNDKRPIATSTVGNACQLDMFLPTWMDPDDISADVTWTGAEVEKLSADFRDYVAMDTSSLTSHDVSLTFSVTLTC